jgi:hypothetical protein
MEFALGARDLEDPLEKTYLAKSPPAMTAYEFSIREHVCVWMCSRKSMSNVSGQEGRDVEDARTQVLGQSRKRARSRHSEHIV